MKLLMRKVRSLDGGRLRRGGSEDNDALERGGTCEETRRGEGRNRIMINAEKTGWVMNGRKILAEVERESLGNAAKWKGKIEVGEMHTRH